MSIATYTSIPKGLLPIDKSVTHGYCLIYKDDRALPHCRVKEGYVVCIPYTLLLFTWEHDAPMTHKAKWRLAWLQPIEIQVRVQPPQISISGRDNMEQL